MPNDAPRPSVPAISRYVKNDHGDEAHAQDGPAPKVKHATKRCSICKFTLPTSSFYPRRARATSGGDGLRSTCKECARVASAFTTPTKRLSRLLSNARYRAQNRGSPFPSDLTTSDLVSLLEAQSGLCALTGVPLTFHTVPDGDRRALSSAASIDRIDNSLSYCRDNIQLVTATANRMKGALTERALLEQSIMIVETLSKRL